MHTMESIINQHQYQPGISNAVWKKVKNCDTFLHTKWSNTTYGKLLAKETWEIQQNKHCVYIMDTCVIRRKGNKYDFHLKSDTMIDPVTG